MTEAPAKQDAVDAPRGAEAPKSGGPALEADHLTRAVIGKILTNDISVQVQAGEVVAVTGPSASGKSSFLHLLNRLDEADRRYRTPRWP
jgi:ABC-type phosphate transport system ATPase subunit